MDEPMEQDPAMDGNEAEEKDDTMPDGDESAEIVSDGTTDDAEPSDEMPDDEA